MRSILSSVSYFSGLSADDLRLVEQAAVRRVFQPKQRVVMEGDPGGGLYIVESGWLKVIKQSAGGREQVLHFLGPNQVFNAVEVFTEMPTQASVVALEESVVWWIERGTMQNLVGTRPDLARGVIRDLAGRLQHLVGLVEDLSLRTIESRLARVLVEDAAQATVTRRKWLTQVELAARLGTVPDVLNRALRKLEEEGLIEVTRQQIRIKDLAALQHKIDAD